MTVLFRTAAGGDIPALVTLIRECFDGPRARFLTITQHGTAKSLRDVLDGPRATTGRTLYVATTSGGRIVGFLDLRLSGETAFVAYICVDRELRGQGIAPRLIESALAENSTATRLELDVFEDNVAARQLYARLGFVDNYRTSWLRRDLPTPSGWTTIDDILESDAMFSTFGFCTFTSTWRGTHVKFGRIGRSVLNCFRLGDFIDDPQLAAFRHRIPELREAMTTIPSVDLKACGSVWESIGVSVRASLSLTDSHLDSPFSVSRL